MTLLATPGPDANSYADELRKRALRLSTTGMKLRRQQLTGERDIRRSGSSLHQELADLSRDLDAFAAELSGTARRVRRLVALLQQLAQQPQLRRVEEKAELWHPERFVTRAEFSRMLARRR